MKFLFLLVILVFLPGCDSGPEKTQEQIQADIAANQETFAREKERIEQENQAREAKLVEQRSYVSVQLISVDADWLIVDLVNETDRDIDNLSGSLEVLDPEGNYVTGIALTNWVPGDIYLPTGATARAQKSLTLESSEKRAQIIDGAQGFSYQYTTLRIQFAGDKELSYLEWADQPAQEEVITPDPAEAKPVNQANPELCKETQITLETAEETYPGPECEHIGRNIDSERFKVEYINMCKSKLGIEGLLQSVARVQISMCMRAPGGNGIVYSKRICCDRP